MYMANDISRNFFVHKDFLPPPEVWPGTLFTPFKMESFFFAPIGRATPDWFTVLLSYIILLIIHGAPYLPSYLANRKKARTEIPAGA